ncbi:MAG: hypothetical protein M1436_05715 [Acidobacteria bacterium]|nr:hypothetical protein [Acidobacteriota bacterium]
MFYPLVEIGKQHGRGLGPYAIGFVFCLGIFLSTFVFNFYFMRKPVQGKPLRMADYFRGNRMAHTLGIVGGLMWSAGTLSNFVASSAPKELQVGPAVSYALGQGSTMVGAFWGVFIWKEFAGGGPLVRRLVPVMFLLFIVGLVAVSVAPLYVGR